VIERRVSLRCTRSRAFQLFTEHAGEWWPHDLRHTDDQGSEIRILAEGRFFERAGDGTEVELGRVTAWEPPARIDLDFYPGTGVDHPTLLTVRFEEEGAGTLVHVTHRPGPASEELWSERATGYDRAWTLVFEALADPRSW